MSFCGAQVDVLRDVSRVGACERPDFFDLPCDLYTNHARHYVLHAHDARR